ncbi:unnamed protein product [Microthlaspi erraticum]|uniref:Uncharacterized protein n=1 Tax=Microthlaspi erraticum TaxID=1685480 RepID=A0A6D2KYJ2_9BRAS|nr:unnamed protein product [Microthlaspi erraticum]
MQVSKSRTSFYLQVLVLATEQNKASRILIWKDRYLSHASRQSGMKPFGSTIGPNLFSTETCPVSEQTEPMEDLECLMARAAAPKALIEREEAWLMFGAFLGTMSAHTRRGEEGSLMGNFPFPA